MKRLTEYFKSLPFKTQSNIRVGLFIVVVLILSYILTSCGVSQPMQTKPDFQIEWTDTTDYETISIPDEDLLVPNPKDYVVLEYEYPYALVMFSDSTLDYKFSLEPLEIGSIAISNKR